MVACHRTAAQPALDHGGQYTMPNGLLSSITLLHVHTAFAPMDVQDKPLVHTLRATELHPASAPQAPHNTQPPNAPETI